MNICVVSNLSNGIGLERDFRLLKNFLEPKHKVTGIQFDAPEPENLPFFELAIFLETVPRHLLRLAEVNWLIVNAEWFKPEYKTLVERYFAKVLTKTHEAQRIFEPLFPHKTFYVGFLARDQFVPWIDRERKFLHIGGNSSLRNTEAIRDAWRWKHNGQRIEAELVVISTALKTRESVQGVTLHERVSDDELLVLQNSCLFHLYPSGTEGFGQALHEALGVSAVILTTDAPPMNEIKSAYRIPASGKRKYGMADVYEVSALDVHMAVQDLLKLRPPYSFQPRQEFLEGNESFKAAFSKHLEELIAPGPATPVDWTSRTPWAPWRAEHSIAFLGNFRAEHSTENLVKWALERLDIEVEPIQEDRATLEQLQRVVYGHNLFLWVRTPGWLQINDDVMVDFLGSLKKRRITSFSVHLDKFWGLPEREALIGKHPFWLVDYCFTADGSRQNDFRARGVNHFWMKPAMSEVYLHRGVVRDQYRCDVMFCGSKDYHREYPFRAELVNFLTERYGDRFKHINSGLRGHDLNDAYASAKVIVGDHIFAGSTPRYWSDRLPETCGRYGCLLYPRTEGMETPVALYEPQNLTNLEESIEECLASDLYRQQRIEECAEHVRHHDTWTIRLKQILEIVRP